MAFIVFKAIIKKLSLPKCANTQELHFHGSMADICPPHLDSVSKVLLGKHIQMIIKEQPNK